MGICIFRRRPPTRNYSVEVIDLPEHPETCRIYVVQTCKVYVNACAVLGANVDRKFETAREFRRFIGKERGW